MHTRGGVVCRKCHFYREHTHGVRASEKKNITKCNLQLFIYQKLFLSLGFESDMQYFILEVDSTNCKLFFSYFQAIFRIILCSRFQHRSYTIFQKTLLFSRRFFLVNAHTTIFPSPLANNAMTKSRRKFFSFYSSSVIIKNLWHKKMSAEIIK